MNGEEIMINKVVYYPEARAYKNTIGQILRKTESGFVVKTKDSFVEVVEYEYNGKIRVGDRFKNE